MPRCPVCGDPIELASTPAAPFCGERCRTIDLGRWLGEAYSLPETRLRESDDPDQAVAEE
ncbi:MAG: DNA gyrase inhibitor YacG [Planctomycetes bacterium]|nr:DNA gyrase inhibitor YacG [Planctomycetota bacterium]